MNATKEQEHTYLKLGSRLNAEARESIEGILQDVCETVKDKGISVYDLSACMFLAGQSTMGLVLEELVTEIFSSEQLTVEEARVRVLEVVKKSAMLEMMKAEVDMPIRDFIKNAWEMLVLIDQQVDVAEVDLNECKQLHTDIENLYQRVKELHAKYIDKNILN